MKKELKKEDLLSLVENLLHHNECESVIMETIYNEAKKINSQIMSTKPYEPFYTSNDGNDVIYTGEKYNNLVEVFFATIINGEPTAACVHYMFKDAYDTIDFAAMVKHFHEDAVDTVKKLNDE